MRTAHPMRAAGLLFAGMSGALETVSTVSESSMAAKTSRTSPAYLQLGADRQTQPTLRHLWLLCRPAPRLCPENKPRNYAAGLDCHPQTVFQGWPRPLSCACRRGSDSVSQIAAPARGRE